MRRALLAACIALVANFAQSRELIVEPVEFPLETGGQHLKLVGTLLRPTGAGPFPAVVLNHGAWGPAQKRREKPRLDYAPLSTWLAERGYAVLVPMRRGYGASEGETAESSGGCADPDYVKAGLAGAEDILAALRWLQAQSFADARRSLLVGYSAGGWGSLAAASLRPAGLIALVNLAGGRGGFAGNGWPCVAPRMIEAAHGFAARNPALPSLWLYGVHDALFGPEFARQLAGAWNAAGGTAELHAIAPDFADGHGVFEAAEGVAFWAPLLAEFLDRAVPGQPVSSLPPPR